MKKKYTKINLKIIYVFAVTFFITLPAFSSKELKAQMPEWKHILKDSIFINIAEYDSSIWLVKSNFRAFKFDLMTETFTDSLDFPCSNLESDVNGNLWLYNNMGFAKYDGNELTIWDKEKMLEEGFPDGDIIAFRADRTGNLWISFSHQGLARYDGESITVYDSKTPGVPKDFGGQTYITSIDFDSKNNVWVTSFEGGIGKFDGNEWIAFNKENSGIHTDETMSIKVDKKDFIWITSSFGLIKYDNIGWYLYSTINSDIPERVLHSLVIDSKNNIWCKAGLNSGLIKFDGKNFTSYQIENSDISSNTINSVFVDSYDNIWIAMSILALRSGVNIYNEEGIVIISSVEDSDINLSELYITPLPAYAYINISGIDYDENIVIYDVVGNKLIETKYNGKINTGTLPVGVYYIKSGNKGGKFVKF